MRWLCVAIGLLTLAGCAQAPWTSEPAPPQVSYMDLLEDLTSLDALADFPDPPFLTLRASSYDRRSVSPDAAGWFANEDSGRYLRREQNEGRGEYVLMQSARPGAIVRIWADAPEGAGTIRVYLDEAPEPAIAAPLADLLSGETAPFIEPLARGSEGGWECVLPIPYSHSCRITSDVCDLRYQIDYREYAPDAQLPVWNDDLLELYAEDIESARMRLARPMTLAPLAGGHALARRYDARLAPGQDWEAPFMGWREAIHRLSCRIEASDVELARRAVTVEITFDNHKEPDVIAPLGDFFGAAPGAVPFKTLATGLFEDGTMYSHWVMPYAWRVKLRFVNQSTIPVTLTGEIVTDRRPRNQNTMYFHAKWRAAFDEPSTAHRDWTLLNAAGRGRLVGFGLCVANPSAQPWGGGDDKIYVDSMGFPALFGTGTPDAFGFGPNPLESACGALNAISLDANLTPAGRTALTRVATVAAIPFEENLRLDFETFSSAPDSKLDWAGMTYWYSDAESTDTFSRPTPDQLRLPANAQ